MAMKRRTRKWWKAAEYAYQHNGVSFRQLAVDLGIDRVYLRRRRDAEGWKILGGPPFAEVNKQFQKASMTRGQEAEAERLAELYRVTKRVHTILIGECRKEEQRAAERVTTTAASDDE